MKLEGLCLIFFVIGSTLASDRSKSSSLEGFVTVDAVSPLSGVTIGVDNLARGTHLQSTTNTSGHYLFEDIRPGAYSVSAEAKGYGCIIYPRIVVNYGERVRQDFTFVRGKALGDCETADKNKT
jgi:hypothetical protein